MVASVSDATALRVIREMQESIVQSHYEMGKLVSNAFAASYDTQLKKISRPVHTFPSDDSQSIPIELIPRLQEFFGKKSARFKSHQQGLALKHILNPNSCHVLVVLAAGGGKSLLFQLLIKLKLLSPSAHGEMVIIVIEPYAKLLLDQLAEADALGVPACHWSPGCDIKMEPLIFVSANAVGSDAFQSLVTYYLSEQRLARLFMDECHLPPRATATFRPELTGCSKLGRLGVSVACLSASLSPSEAVQTMEFYGEFRFISFYSKPYRLLTSHIFK
jgi:superfamily II DNA helicase RecQ